MCDLAFLLLSGAESLQNEWFGTESQWFGNQEFIAESQVIWLVWNFCAVFIILPNHTSLSDMWFGTLRSAESHITQWCVIWHFCAASFLKESLRFSLRVGVVFCSEFRTRPRSYAESLWFGWFGTQKEWFGMLQNVTESLFLMPNHTPRCDLVTESLWFGTPPSVIWHDVQRVVVLTESLWFGKCKGVIW